MVLAIVAAVSAGIVLRDDDAPAETSSLGGAELLAGPDGPEERPTPGDRLVDLRLGRDEAYNDFRAYDVRTDFDGNLYLLTGWAECDNEDCYGFISRMDDDLVVEAAPRYSSVTPGQLAVAPDGRVARLASNTQVFDLSPRREPERLPALGFAPLSGSYTEDGTLVVSAYGEPRIVAVRPDGTVEHLLAPASSPEPAPARFGSDTAALTVVTLPDGRIAFATNAPDDPDLDGRVFLLQGESLQPLDLPDAEPIRRIFPGPDGTLLALEGPHIAQIDPDAATVDRLIDLSEVADELAPASDDWPPVQAISAAAHGSDLLFTADYKLWRLPDAFG